MNSFNFFLSGKLFICPLILNDSFAGQSNLGCRPLLFMTLNISCQSLLACQVSLEKPADSLVGTSLQVTNLFSVAVFKSPLFVCNLQLFHYDVSWSGPLCIHHDWNSVLPQLACLFPSPNQGSFLSLLFKQISNLLLYLFSFQHPYYVNVGPLEVFPEAVYTLLIWGVLFSSCCSAWLFLSSLCSKSLI